MPLLHIIGSLSLIAGTFAGGLFAARRRRGALIGLVGSGVLAAIAYALWLRPDVMTTLFPFPGVAFYGNLFPVAAALFCPCTVIMRRGRAQRIRIAVLCCSPASASEARAPRT